MRLSFSSTVIVFFMLLFSCHHEGATQTNTITLGSFSLEIPESWRYVKMKGIDSYIGCFVTDYGDTIYFDKGRYSPSLVEEYVRVRPYSSFKEYEQILDLEDYEDIIFSKSYERDVRYGVHFNNYYYLDTISGCPAIIVMPKKRTQGITGIYIDSIDVNSHSFSLYGRNLDAGTSQMLNNSFRTLKVIQK
jgi:hypothetical protein